MGNHNFSANKGVTQSEKVLIDLAQKSFLNLWHFPNVYKEVGKELCDLFVVCGEYIIIFSDKTISWKDDINPQLAWSRWYKQL